MLTKAGNRVARAAGSSGPGGGIDHAAGLEKRILDVLLRRVHDGVVTVEYWDGERRAYGDPAPSASTPTVTIRLSDPSVFRRCALNPSVAFGESYTSGAVQIAEDELPALFRIVHDNRDMFGTVSELLRRAHRREPNHRRRQQDQIRRHYDVGNDYYRLFLDPTLTYSCAYFERTDDGLEQAQRQKIDHVLRKLRLEPGHQLLDIGCGWGHLAVTAAVRFGARVVGITLSEEQLAAARGLARQAGVADRVRFALHNYQDLPTSPETALRGPFDRVVSIGMFEHVGRGMQARYLEVLDAVLAEGGVSVLHTITQQRDTPLDAWTDRHVFPGGHLPTVAQIERTLADRGLWSIDRENLWAHYALTLARWREEHRRHRSQIVSMFDEEFYRTRELWLAASQSGFAHGELGLSQFVIGRGKLARWPLTRRHLYPTSPADDGPPPPAGSAPEAGHPRPAPPAAP